MKKYRKRNIYFDSNNTDPNDKYNSNIDTFHNKKIKNFDEYEKTEIPKIRNKIKIIDNYLNQGWILYKKNDKYYFLKNKEIYKNKNINLKELFKNSE